jgi:RNA polymerase sigma-70 factor (sigma-E family)
MSAGTPSSRDDFETLYRAEATHLLRLAVLLCGDRDLAEDAVADAVARTWRNWDADRITDPSRYLRRAVVNAVTDRFRRRGRHREHLRRRSGDDRGAAVLADDVTNRRIVLDALAQLPPEQRAVVVLRYFDDRSEADIADLLGISAGTVKSRSSRGLTTLARLLEDREVTHG